MYDRVATLPPAILSNSSSVSSASSGFNGKVRLQTVSVFSITLTVIPAGTGITVFPQYHNRISQESLFELFVRPCLGHDPTPLFCVHIHSPLQLVTS